MKHLRAPRILALAIGLAASLALIGHALVPKNQDTVNLVGAERLEKIAKHRFESARGLSPCNDYYAYETLKSAGNRLVTIGDSNANPIVVVAPTFSEIELIAFGPGYIRAYRFPGQTGFTPPSSEWFSPTPQKIAEVLLTPSEQFEIVTPIHRHIKYAMTARDLGNDGVSYYFGDGAGGCAFAWMPRGEGPSGLIAQMIAEASGQAPSRERLLALARAIDHADNAR